MQIFLTQAKSPKNKLYEYFMHYTLSELKKKTKEQRHPFLYIYMIQLLL